MIAVHNPSLKPVSYIKVKVSHGNYRITDFSSGNSYQSAVICFDRLDENLNEVNDCEMHIEA